MPGRGVTRSMRSRTELMFQVTRVSTQRHVRWPSRSSVLGAGRLEARRRRAARAHERCAGEDLPAHERFTKDQSGTIGFDVEIRAALLRRRLMSMTSTAAFAPADQIRRERDRRPPPTAAILAQLAEGVIVTDAAGADHPRQRGRGGDPRRRPTRCRARRLQRDLPPLHRGGRALRAARTAAGACRPWRDGASDERWRIVRPDGHEVLAIGSAQPLRDARRAPGRRRAHGARRHRARGGRALAARAQCQSRRAGGRAHPRGRRRARTGRSGERAPSPNSSPR